MSSCHTKSQEIKPLNFLLYKTLSPSAIEPYTVKYFEKKCTKLEFCEKVMMVGPIQDTDQMQRRILYKWFQRNLIISPPD